MERLLFKQRKTASLQDTLTQELVRLSCSRKAPVAILGLFLSPGIQSDNQFRRKYR